MGWRGTALFSRREACTPSAKLERSHMEVCGALKVTASQVPQDHLDGGRAEQTGAIGQMGRVRSQWRFVPITVEPLGKGTALVAISLDWGPGSASIVTLRDGAPSPGRAIGLLGYWDHPGGWHTERSLAHIRFSGTVCAKEKE